MFFAYRSCFARRPRPLNRLGIAFVGRARMIIGLLARLGALTDDWTRFRLFHVVLTIPQILVWCARVFLEDAPHVYRG